MSVRRALEWAGIGLAGLGLAACSSAARPQATSGTPPPATTSLPATTQPAPTAGTTTGTTSPPSAPASSSPASSAAPSASPQTGGTAVPAGFAPLSASSVSATETFVLGTIPGLTCPKGVTQGNGCSSVARTTDGGKTWRALAAVPANPFGQGVTGSDVQGVGSIRFASPSVGYVYGAQLFVTRDGGGSWTELKPPVAPGTSASGDGISDLEVGNGRVWLLDGGQLYDAPLSGSTFVKAGVGDSGENNGSFGVVLHGAAVYLLSSTGDKPTLEASPTGGAFVSRALPCTDPEGVSASTDTALTLDCGSFVASGSMGSRALWGSTDAGAHWTKLPTPGFTGHLTDISDIGGGRLLIAVESGGPPVVEVSGDGARTFRAALTGPNDGGEPFVDAGFVTPGVATAVIADSNGQPAGALYRSADGGGTWSKLTIR